MAKLNKGMSVDAQDIVIESPCHERMTAGIKGLDAQATAIALNDNFLKNTYQATLDASARASELQAGIRALRIVCTAGWGIEAKAQAASLLEGLGISPASAKLSAASEHQFKSVSMDRLLTMVAERQGRQADGDSTRARQTFVMLANTREAIEFVLDFAEANASVDQHRAQYYEHALPHAQQSGDLTRIDREWRKVQGSIWADPHLQRWSK